MTKLIKQRRTVLLILTAIAFAGIVIYRTFLYTPSAETLKATTFRVSGGWGYDIAVHGKGYIHQPFIPGIPGRKPFPDRRSARRASKTVKARLANGLAPVLTQGDLLKIGIDSLGNSH